MCWKRLTTGLLAVATILVCVGFSAQLADAKERMRTKTVAVGDVNTAKTMQSLQSSKFEAEAPITFYATTRSRHRANTRNSIRNASAFHYSTMTKSTEKLCTCGCNQPGCKCGRGDVNITVDPNGPKPVDIDLVPVDDLGDDPGPAPAPRR